VSATSAHSEGALGEQPASAAAPPPADRAEDGQPVHSRLLARLGRAVAAHRAFSVVLAAATLLRIVVMLGYPPAMFFNDSYNYLTDAIIHVPDPIRSSGYPLFLFFLEEFHNLSVVTGLQALMGLAVGVGLYAVLRRRGLPAWGAIVCSLPVLFDAYELQLEHMVASDVLFYTLLTAALILLCWWDRPPVVAAVLAGLMVGYAATVRNVGEIMLVFIIAGMLARRMGWRPIVAALVAGLAPIIAYMFWYQAGTGRFAMSAGDGTFLYSRVQTFTDCAKIKPPPNLAGLCDPRPPADRENSQEYLWANDTPLARWTGPYNVFRFTPQVEKGTGRFAEWAIEAQPLAYASVVAGNIGTTFEWSKVNANNPVGNLEGDGSKFRFTSTVWPVPAWVTEYPANRKAATEFGGADFGQPKVVRPWAGFLEAYQPVYLRGPFLLLFVLAGLAGVVLSARRREWARGGVGGPGLMSWMVGAALIVLPPMTAGFSYRYALAAVPAVCLAAGLAFAGRGNLMTWVRNRSSRLQLFNI